MNKRMILVVTVIIGVIGATLFGYAFAVYNDGFTPRQLEYIDGVAQGGFFKGEASPGDPRDKCIKQFYPDKLIALAGCIEALNGQEWALP